MSKHTKGPWSVSEHEDNGEVVVRDACDCIVSNCSIDQEMYRDRQEQEVNAAANSRKP